MIRFIDSSPAFNVTTHEAMMRVREFIAERQYRKQFSSSRSSARPAHSSLSVGQLRAFLIELGRDFCYVGSEFPLQVGGRDFALDLLFFHRGLNCLLLQEAL